MLRSGSFGLPSVTLCLADERMEGQVNHPINWLAWQHPLVHTPRSLAIHNLQVPPAPFIKLRLPSHIGVAWLL